MGETNEINAVVTTKKCSKCGEVKELQDFNVLSSSKDGRQTRCKMCFRDYYLKNRSELIARNKRHREKNKSLVSEQRHKYYEKNKSKIAEYQRKYREDNRAEIAARRREYCKTNRIKIFESQKKYREENRLKISEMKKRYHKENPEVKQRSENKRRALKRNLPHQPLTPQQYEILHRQKYEIFGGNASGN